MQIEDAIEILKEIQETNRAWLKETEEEICEKIYLKDIEAIDTVLNELERLNMVIDKISQNPFNELKVNGIRFCGTDIKEYFYKEMSDTNE